MQTSFHIIFNSLKENTEFVPEEKLSVGVVSSQKILDGTASLGDIETMCSIAHKILEPSFFKDEHKTDYDNYIESKPSKWIDMIHNEFGHDWGTIAEAVIAYNG